MLRSIIRLLIAIELIGLLFPMASCARRQDRSGFSEALIVLPNAKNVKFVKFNGTDQVSYEITMEYPADEAIQNISNSLSAHGWNALKMDFLNPDIPNSHVRGWTNFLDATRKPTQEVHQWLADWKNEAGEIVRFALMYQYAENSTPDMKNLQIAGIFIPAAGSNPSINN